MQKVVACYHGGCSDGIASAWVLSKRFPNASFYGIRPAETELGHIDFEDSTVFFLDVCPSSFPDNAKEIFVFDHHVTNKRIVDNLDQENIRVVFDSEKCGCLITWDELFPFIERPWFLLYVDDRDRWQWKLENSREINEAMYSQGWMERLDELVFVPKEELTSVGIFLLQEKENKIVGAMKNTARAKFCDFDIWLCEAPEQSVWQIRSEVGNRLCSIPFPDGQKPSFSAIWKKDEETQNIWVSLRGTNGCPCLASLSERFGGGGHPKAASFSTSSLSEIIQENYFFAGTSVPFFC
ncbi:putative DHH superfamily phosphohydrolase [Brazilian marseillevirus]|uniref:DHH phosphoesterase n=1 Tax=Brazilian marseillevirus TaxID=1813599 RepID=UPI0007867B85|nr:DHH phosphoesterase [Brazilian marseillevirus]AMQ10557.1 putative DHH superfamily phosphohydrolase [Brazilian marseillevirus]